MEKEDYPKFKNMTKEERKEWEKKMESFYGFHSKAHMVKSINQIKGWLF